MTLYTWFDRLIAAAERKFGWLALPNLLRWVGIFQILTFLLSRLSPGFREAVVFDASKILSGEVWRLVAFIVLPGSENILFFIIGVMFLLWMNEGMEQAWGSFRVCLYALVSALGLMAGNLALSLLPGGAAAAASLTTLGGFVWYEAIFLAFATLYSDLTVRLYFVIPVRLKYLAWFAGALLVLTAMAGVAHALLVLLGAWPYLAVFLPHLFGATIGAARQKRRREGYQREVAAAEAEDSLHRCHRCGLTDAESPRMDFRVASDGEEYCEPCREARRQEAAAAG